MKTINLLARETLASKKCSDGALKSFSLKDGNKQGYATRKHIDGSLEEFSYFNGIRQGPTSIPYPTGDTLNSNYINGKLEGILMKKFAWRFYESHIFQRHS